MHILRPLKMCRNIFGLKHRINVLSFPSISLSTGSHVQLLCSRLDIPKVVIPTVNHLTMHNRLVYNQSGDKPQVDVVDKNALALSDSFLVRCRQHLDPYARLMRIDRPIGK